VLVVSETRAPVAGFEEVFCVPATGGFSAPLGDTCFFDFYVVSQFFVAECEKF